MRSHFHGRLHKIVVRDKTWIICAKLKGGDGKSWCVWTCAFLLAKFTCFFVGLEAILVGQFDHLGQIRLFWSNLSPGLWNQNMNQYITDCWFMLAKTSVGKKAQHVGWCIFLRVRQDKLTWQCCSWTLAGEPGQWFLLGKLEVGDLLTMWIIMDYNGL